LFVQRQRWRYHITMQSQRIVSIAAWALLAFIAFVTLSPVWMRPELTESEPDAIVFLERAAGYGVLALLFLVSHPDRIRTVCLIVFGSAVIFELGQIFLPDRHARISDVAEKAVGGGLGILIGIALLPLLLGENGLFSRIDQHFFGRGAGSTSESRELFLGFSAIVIFAISLVLLQKISFQSH
jgi:VanZ family protein